MSEFFLAVASNPLRLPDWRFQLVNDYRLNSSGAIEVPDEEDLYVKEYLEFFKAYVAAQTDRKSMIRLREANPGLFDCYQLAHLDHTYLRDVIDAFLLTGIGFSRISCYVSASPETLEWYERMHFDVLSRLNNRIWIANYLLNSYKRKIICLQGTITHADEVRRKQYEEDTAVIHKLCGLYGGPLVLEMMYTGFNFSAVPETQDAVAPYVNTMIQNFVKSRGAVASRLVGYREESLVALISDATSMATSIREETRTEYTEQVQAALKTLPWAVGSESKYKLDVGTPIEKLTSDTRLELNATQKNILTNLENFRYPE